MTSLHTAQAARKDIQDIRKFRKSRFGSRVVRDYLNGLSATFDLIAARPSIGAPESDLGSGMRSFAYRSHRTYYRPDGDGLLVLRVLHRSRDVSQAFEARS